MKKIFLGILIVCITIIFSIPSVGVDKSGVEKADSSTWVATDCVDRTLSTNELTGDIRDEKYVGLFYWNWHTPAFRSNEYPVNNTLVTDIFGESMWNDVTHPAWGPEYMNHSYNEPIYNYYLSTDKWVIRRHAEILADAGVDVIFFDCTNGDELFDEGYRMLFETFQEAYEDGVKVPKISFLLSFAGETARKSQVSRLYDEIYSQHKYKDTWFYFKGKLLMMGETKFRSEDRDDYEQINDLFDFKSVESTYTNKTMNKWTWSSVYPQLVAYHRDENGKKTNEQVSVSVAMNCDHSGGLSSSNAGKTYVNGRTYSFSKREYDERENAVMYGEHFAEQFEFALKKDPSLIFITGWNERIAMRFPEWCGTTNGFADQFIDEFSRDAEISAGKLKDSYYYQMVDYIRKFKGTKKAPKASEMKVIDINSTEDQWGDIGPEYVAYKNNTFDRDSQGYGAMHYYNTTGRNDIISAKTAHDSENLYFMVDTAEKLSPRSDSSWMRLLLDVNDSSENWETFDYIINRESPKGTATLEKSTGGWNFEEVGQVYYSINRNRLQIKIPKKLLGISGDKFSVNFKWSDNMQKDGDIMDFYINGDVAPSGRYKYVYTTKD